MRSIVSAYVREFGALNLIAEALAVATVFALLGIAFASPAATTATSNSPEVVASEARGEQP